MTSDRTKEVQIIKLGNIHQRRKCLDWKQKEILTHMGHIMSSHIFSKLDWTKMHLSLYMISIKLFEPIYFPWYLFCGFILILFLKSEIWVELKATVSGLVSIPLAGYVIRHQSILISRFYFTENIIEIFASELPSLELGDTKKYIPAGKGKQNKKIKIYFLVEPL